MNARARFIAQTARWKADCRREFGKVLSGEFSHYCPEWDYLPVDETSPEFDCCTCFKTTREWLESLPMAAL